MAAIVDRRFPSNCRRRPARRAFVPSQISHRTQAAEEVEFADAVAERLPTSFASASQPARPAVAALEQLNSVRARPARPSSVSRA